MSNVASSEREFLTSLGYIPNVVYHYCSLEAFLGIISSKSIWVTSLNATNDKKELSFGRKLVEATICDMLSNQKYTHIKTILEKIYNTREEKAINLQLRPPRYYGASFVRSEDSLIHWERYGNRGMGVCIAFDLCFLPHFFDNYALPDICHTWLWYDSIRYDEQHKKQFIEETISGYIARIAEHGDIDKFPSFYQVIFYLTISSAKPRFKHNGFSDENEYRLVLEEGEPAHAAKLFKSMINDYESENTTLFANISMHLNEAIDELGVAEKDKKYRVFENGIRSYYALNLHSIWSKNLIPRITIGPKCPQNVKELQSFLKANSLDGVKIQVSKIPIR